LKGVSIKKGKLQQAVRQRIGDARGREREGFKKKLGLPTKNEIRRVAQQSK